MYRLLAFVFIAGLFAQSINARTLDYPFKSKLYTADVFSWIDGSDSGPVQDRKGKMAKALYTNLLESQRYIDLAIYGIAHQDWIFTALGTLVADGVRVRSVVDQKRGGLNQWLPQYFAYPDTPRLVNTLEPGHVLPDVSPDDVPRAGSIMHNKFVVMDREKVWLGSTNLSSTGIGSEYNANTSIIIDSPDLARIYANEFQQMFGKRRFSIYKSPRADRYPLEFSDGTVVKVFFSPQDNALEAAILPFIASATHSLELGMFYLTEERVVAALIDAANRGVDVRIIYDALAAAHHSSYHQMLRREGVVVRVENWGGKMHMKTVVADKRNVLMGSMNWSEAGSQINDENTIIVENNTALALGISNYFNRLWDTLEAVGADSDPRAESSGSINSCRDGLDNDHDGNIDSEDTACK